MCYSMYNFCSISRIDFLSIKELAINLNEYTHLKMLYTFYIIDIGKRAMVDQAILPSSDIYIFFLFFSRFQLASAHGVIYERAP